MPPNDGTTETRVTHPPDVADRSEHAAPDVPGEDRRASYREDTDGSGHRDGPPSADYRVDEELDEAGDDAPDSE